MSLFPESMYEARIRAEQGVFDDGSDLVIMAYVWLSSFLRNVVALPMGFFLLASNWREALGFSLGSLRKNHQLFLGSNFILEAKVWRRLQSMARDMIFDSGHFPGSSQYHHPTKSGRLHVWLNF